VLNGYEILRSSAQGGLILPRRIVLRLAQRAAVAWLAGRAAALIVGELHMSLVGLVWFVPVVLALVWVDLRRSQERLLYGNLGVSPHQISAITLVVILSLEIPTELLISEFLGDVTWEALL